MTCSGAKESGRRYIWKVTCDAIVKAPWLGYGLNTMHLPNPDPNHRYPDGTPMDFYDRSHCEFLQVAFDTGFVGLACYLAIVGLAIAHSGILLPSLIAYMLWSLFGWNHIGPANVWWLLIGVCAR